MAQKVVILLVLSILPLLSYEREFRKLDEALASIFPGAQIEIKNITLSKEEVERAQKLARVKLDSRLVSFYIAKRNGKILGYAFVDVHRVRTKNESVLFVISPEGKIELVEILSFNEPLEYMADEDWLALFKGKSLERDKIRLRRDIPNMTGATLTARAIVKSARKVLAIWQVVFKER